MNKIAVLMSTYNGERYLDNQIQSIFSQQETDVSIWIRDDGSTDHTIHKIQAWVDKAPEKVHLIKGINIGYKRSFLQLLKIVPNEYDYYAFSDQDDIWLPQKCKAAVELLEKEKNQVKLYTSNLDVVNERLEPLYKTHIEKKFHISLYGFWIRGRFAGCTYLFSEQLKNMAATYADMDLPNYSMPSHDFVVATIAFLYGSVLFDESTYIFHRRLQTSVTSGGRGVWNRLQTEFNYIFKKKDIRYMLAKEVLSNRQAGIDPKGETFLMAVAEYKDNFFHKFRLLCFPSFKSGSLIFDIQAKCKVLLSNF